MVALVLSFILSITFLCSSCAPTEEPYKSQYEDMDVQSILKSSRLLKNYVDCLLDRGKCPPAAKELKDHIEDALKTECSRCTSKQKALGNTAIDFLMKEKPDMWKELVAKYDPEGIYAAKWEAQAESIKNGGEPQPNE
ncbi:hypothetical protein WA026_019004 [Henosepilachna vigintioctopunctata]|uniref:Chemosensory protein n=1 Tax=Henosepilachna vigintioctopunctata TaxID=420089 RepID=A0AAW1VIJ0_9CUCU